MTTRSRLEAELATRRYTRRHAREIVTAMLGNNAGTVVATTDTRWCWIRLHGDANQVVRAWNAGFVPPVNNLPVDVEIVKGNGITDYQIVGVSINKGVAADAYADATGMHALQHQRRDFNTGGFDPLDIYARAIVQLRARAQIVPDMTLYVEAGWYPVAGIATYFAGGNSPAFTAPGGGARCDLLYLDSTGTLQIVTGTVAVIGTPPRPTQPTADDLPLAYVYLTAATTTITEYIIEDARVLFGGSNALTTPGGADTDVQFNDGGAAFGGNAGFIYDKTGRFVGIRGTGIVTAPSHPLHIIADDPISGGIPTEQAMIGNPTTPGGATTQANLGFAIYDGAAYQTIGWVGVTGGNFTYGPYPNATYLENFSSGGVVILSDDPANGTIDFFAGGYTLSSHRRVRINPDGTVRQYGQTFLNKPTSDAGIGFDPNGATGNFQIYLSPPNLTANRRATLQDADGTVAYLADIPPPATGGADHVHGIARWAADGAVTNFELPDVAEYLEWATDNGVLQDQATISLATSNTQLAFDSAPTAGHVIQAEYVIARI